MVKNCILIRKYEQIFHQNEKLIKHLTAVEDMIYYVEPETVSIN